MFSLLKKLLNFLLLIVLVAILGRNDLPRWALEYRVRDTTGQPLHIEAISFSNFQPARIKGYDFTLQNAFRFPAGNALKGSRFEILFPRSFWYGLSFQIERLTLQIDEVSLVRDAAGELNLASTEGKRGKEKTPAPDKDAIPLIRDLVLSIDRVSYVDLREKSGLSPFTVTIGIKDLDIHDVADLRQLEEIIVRESMARGREKLKATQKD